MASKSLDVFSLRDAVVGEYKKFATSFTTIHAEDTQYLFEHPRGRADIEKAATLEDRAEKEMLAAWTELLAECSRQCPPREGSK